MNIKMNIIMEKRLQHDIVMDFSSKMPKDRGRLFATFSETKSAVQGSQMLSLGLIRGTSDLIYIDDDRHIIGIEIKEKGSRHNVKHVLEQANWLNNWCYRGYFCDSIECFWSIINDSKGIDPKYIIEYLNNIKTKTFTWPK